MRKWISLILIFFLIASCKWTESNTPISKPIDFDKKSYAEDLQQARIDLEKNKNSIPSNKSKPEIIQPETETTILEEIPETLATIPSDTVYLKIHYGKAKADTAKSGGQEVYFVFNSDTAKKLNLKVIPATDTANLRISQIFDPDGNSDGPFGREIQYPIEKSGIYKVRVTESLMQGSPYEGKFSFEVKLGW